MKELIKIDLNKSLKYLLPNLDLLKGKTILITGGTGFIGSWVARGLIWLNDEHNFGCKIVILARNPYKLEEIDSDLYNRNDISFIRADVRGLHSLPTDVNYIIHTVGNPDNRVHMSDPINTMDIIATGTKVLLENATRLEKLESIVCLSSGQVYEVFSENSNIYSQNMCENFLRHDVKSIYPEAKRYSEILCLAYKSLYKFFFYWTISRIKKTLGNKFIFARSSK